MALRILLQHLRPALSDFFGANAKAAFSGEPGAVSLPPLTL